MRKSRERKPQVVVVTAMLAASARYCQAAERDERSGYPCTAALEWRKAAELLAAMPELAEQCWREWERLMRLPRRLAAPIEAAQAYAACARVAPAQAGSAL